MGDGQDLNMHRPYDNQVRRRFWNRFFLSAPVPSLSFINTAALQVDDDGDGDGGKETLKGDCVLCGLSSVAERSSRTGKSSKIKA